MLALRGAPNTHTVPNTSNYVCETLIKVVHATPDLVAIAVAEFDDRMSQQLAISLSDNWSQVFLGRLFPGLLSG